jgi:pimeloyl-ACP methyl ester carboxylesterase
MNGRSWPRTRARVKPAALTLHHTAIVFPTPAAVCSAGIDRPATPDGAGPGLLTGLVAGTLGLAPLRAACSRLLAPLAALGWNEPAARLTDEYDATAPHPTPVVYLHGFLGHPLNLLPLRRFLVARGFRNGASFAYAPALDFDRLALRLEWEIGAICRATGRREVDVVGYSLGGLIARHLIQQGGGGIRRLVTLGAPTVGPFLAEQELAIFAADDRLIATPHPVHGPHGRILVISRCGHLGLPYSPRVWRATVAFLAERGALRVAA